MREPIVPPQRVNERTPALTPHSLFMLLFTNAQPAPRTACATLQRAEGPIKFIGFDIRFIELTMKPFAQLLRTRDRDLRWRRANRGRRILRDGRSGATATDRGASTLVASLASRPAVDAARRWLRPVEDASTSASALAPVTAELGRLSRKS